MYMDAWQKTCLNYRENGTVGHLIDEGDLRRTCTDHEFCAAQSDPLSHTQCRALHDSMWSAGESHAFGDFYLRNGVSLGDNSTEMVEKGVRMVYEEKDNAYAVTNPWSTWGRTRVESRSNGKGLTFSCPGIREGTTFDCGRHSTTENRCGGDQGCCQRLSGKVCMGGEWV